MATISYAGIDLCLDTPESNEWVNHAIKYMDEVLPKRDWPGTWLVGTTYPPHTPFTEEMGCLYWPTGASRWSYFACYITETEYATLSDITGENDFIMSQDSGTITAPMYMLPIKPLAKFGDSPGLYLLQLVDERYYFQGVNCGVEVQTNIGTWADLIGALKTSLGISCTTPSISGAYGNPCQFSDFNATYQNSATMLDGALRNVGMGLCRDLDGAYHIYTINESKGLIDSEQTLLAGGDYTDLSANNKEAVFPGSIDVTFPKMVMSAETNKRCHFMNAQYGRVPYVSLPGDLYVKNTPAASCGYTAGSDYTETFNDTFCALYVDLSSGTPYNLGNINNLAAQIAQDYYDEQDVGVDVVFPSIRNGWDNSATTDALCDWYVYWNNGQCQSRVKRKPFNYFFGNTQYQHLDAAGPDHTDGYWTYVVKTTSTVPAIVGSAPGMGTADVYMFLGTDLVAATDHSPTSLTIYNYSTSSIGSGVFTVVIWEPISGTWQTSTGLTSSGGGGGSGSNDAYIGFVNPDTIPGIPCTTATVSSGSVDLYTISGGTLTSLGTTVTAYNIGAYDATAGQWFPTFIEDASGAYFFEALPVPGGYDTSVQYKITTDAGACSYFQGDANLEWFYDETVLKIEGGSNMPYLRPTLWVNSGVDDDFGTYNPGPFDPYATCKPLINLTNSDFEIASDKPLASILVQGGEDECEGLIQWKTSHTNSAAVATLFQTNNQGADSYVPLVLDDHAIGFFYDVGGSASYPPQDQGTVTGDIAGNPVWNSLLSAINDITGYNFIIDETTSTTPTTDYALVWNGTDYVPAAIVNSIQDDGNLTLTFDASTGNPVNAGITGGVAIGSITSTGTTIDITPSGATGIISVNLEVDPGQVVTNLTTGLGGTLSVDASVGAITIDTVGYSGAVALAPLTLMGSPGSLTVVNGVITAYSAPT